jgi:hypothetical protein
MSREKQKILVPQIGEQNGNGASVWLLVVRRLFLFTHHKFLRRTFFTARKNFFSICAGQIKINE